ncbi:MAG: NAD(P)/FAD-dependent oxidoreductase [Pseudomonadota bacterium]|jgi:predicted NAD/FAD-binding protein
MGYEAARARRIAVIGTGVSGLAAAWLLSKRHHVEVFEAADRIGGHSNTLQVKIDGRAWPVDTGFIVYNEPCYPNLTALFEHLSVPTAASDMTFSVSLDQGRLEYAGSDLAGLIAQPANLVKPRFWSMMSDLLRFYREAPASLAGLGEACLDDWLDARGYGPAFREDHLYPMAAAIWSTPAMEVGRYPAAAFIRFCQNHGLLQLVGRPQWRTVVGGSREYVQRLTASFAEHIHTSTPVTAIRRDVAGVEIIDASGERRRFDAVVIATHADRALAMLAEPSAEERRLLSAFGYSRNEAVLHRDPALMPRRRAAWTSWNYLSDGRGHDRRLSVTYWMNRLQPLGEAPNLFVTLNPLREPRPELVHARIDYEHPLFDSATFQAQQQLWSLQGQNHTWFCGAHFGAGFHEDGVQSGLAVAEDLGGVLRPWRVADQDGRIYRQPRARETIAEAAA